MLNKIEKIFTVLSLILLSTAIVSLIPLSQTGDYNIGIKIIYIAVYIISFGFIIIRKGFINRIIKSTRKQKILILFILFVMASIFWSDNHIITAQRVIAFLGTILFGAYFSSRYELKEQIELLSCACSIIIILSYLTVFLLPSYGISTDNPGSWQGVFNQKNSLGKMMVFSTLILIFYTFSSKNYLKKSLGIILILFSIGLIILSQSKTAIIALIFITLILIFAKLIQKIKKKTILPLTSLILVLGIITGIIFIVYTNETFNALNKDSTLTGRTNLWQLSFEKIKEKPLLGYGYSSFWLGYAGPSKDIWFMLDWEPPHAHNGFIDMILELGIIGFLIFIILFISSTVKAVYLTRINKELINLWPILFLSFIFIYNLTENTLFRQNNIFFALLITILYNLEMEKLT